MSSDLLHVDVDSDAHERINFIKQQITNLTNFLVDHSVLKTPVPRPATTSASFSRNMTLLE